MRIRKGPRAVVWGHLAFLAFVSVIVGIYLIDARGVSLSVNNLLLVQPAAVIALILVACVLPQCFPLRTAADSEIADSEAGDSEPTDPVVETKAEGGQDLMRVGALAALLGVFAIFIEQIGFDIATFLFVAIGLVICGERRGWVVATFSAAFTLFVVYGYSTLVPYPFTMRIL